MTIVILRHGYFGSDGNLTKESQVDAENIGKEIRQLIGKVSDEQIRILSSTAPRCLQSAGKFIEGLGGEIGISEVEELWEDHIHQGNIEQALDIISQLPPHLVLIIFAHLANILPIAIELGFEFKGGYEKIDYLGHLVINNPEKENSKIIEEPKIAE